MAVSMPLMTFPSACKDLMEDALSHTRWKERGEERHSDITRRRLNERKRRSGRGSVYREAEDCQVEWESVSSPGQ